jgi:hypothetical protein
MVWQTHSHTKSCDLECGQTALPIIIPRTVHYRVHNSPTWRFTAQDNSRAVYISISSPSNPVSVPTTSYSDTGIPSSSADSDHLTPRGQWPPDTAQTVTTWHRAVCRGSLGTHLQKRKWHFKCNDKTEIRSLSHSTSCLKQTPLKARLTLDTYLKHCQEDRSIHAAQSKPCVASSVRYKHSTFCLSTVLQGPSYIRGYNEPYTVGRPYPLIHGLPTPPPPPQIAKLKNAR